MPHALFHDILSTKHTPTTHNVAVLSATTAQSGLKYKILDRDNSFVVCFGHSYNRGAILLVPVLSSATAQS